MKKLVLVAGLAVVGFGGWRLLAHRAQDVAADDSDARLLTDRLWIDHIPRNERDTINVFAVLSDQSIGVFEAVSAWQGQFEGFRYEGRRGDLMLVFPQTGKKEKVRAKARECDEQGMDYCLELSGSDHGVKRYYSQKGWELRGVHDAAAIEARAQKLLH